MPKRKVKLISAYDLATLIIYEDGRNPALNLLLADEFLTLRDTLMAYAEEHDLTNLLAGIHRRRIKIKL